MRPGVPSDPEAITAVLDRFDAAQAELAALSFDALTGPEVLTVRIGWRPLSAARAPWITG